MSNDERICSMALTLCQGVGKISAKRLIDEIGSAADVFRLRKELPERIPHLSASIVAALENDEAFARARRELEFAEKNGIECLTLADERYPSRLRMCEDAPVFLFYKGAANLNRLHVVSMVGTRRATDYGRRFCDDFLRDLQAFLPDVLVVSGLAYGIDILSHRAALQHRLATVAILAHGLDRIYPATHRRTAVEMLQTGGLLTEYMSQSVPERYNFISRNRIVAGMSDATIVVESDVKGGSLITADLAGGYHRECFAVPGRTDDATSRGCNNLIRSNKAILLQSAEEFVQAMNWDVPPKPVQSPSFPSLTPEEQQVAALLSRRGEMHINELAVETNIPIHRISALLFEMEMNGIVRALAGGTFRIRMELFP
ncbi:MAG: DNA-processing protein DprA [Prevotellaceae bacterium]|nr:DNA-processing protein DprA [Prevotellaceae bacterium]